MKGMASVERKPPRRKRTERKIEKWIGREAEKRKKTEDPKALIIFYVSKIENIGTLLELPCTLSSKKFLTHKPTYVTKLDFFENPWLRPRIFKKFIFNDTYDTHNIMFMSALSNYLLSSLPLPGVIGQLHHASF